MSHLTITVTVPQETYESFRQRAERDHRSVEEAVLEAMQSSLTEGEGVAEYRQTVLAALDSLDTDTLRQIVTRGAETEDVLLLVALNEKRQREGLKAAEQDVVRQLIRQHDRAVLIRAKALAVLHQRGEDISALTGIV
jgi:plasmid stability protein